MRYSSESIPNSLARCWLLVIGLGIASSQISAQTESSDPRWRYKVDTPATVSSPAIGPDHVVYVGAKIAKSVETGLVLAIKPDGTSRWSNGGFATPEGVESSPALSRDFSTVYVGCNDGRLYALDSVTGSEKWVFDVGRDSAIFSSPAVARDGTIYIGTSNLVFPEDSTFYAVYPDGTKYWAKSAAGGIESSPAIGPDGTIYYGSLDQNVYAVAPDGTEKWHFGTKGPVYASPAIGPDGTIYIGSDAGEFFAFSPDGKVKWQFPLTVGSGAAVGADGTIYIGALDGSMYALDPNGNPRTGWPFKTQNRILSIPAIRGDGTVIFGSDDNSLYAVNPDGTLKWSKSTGDDIESSPAVDTDGSIYIGSSGGFLYAFPGAASPLSSYASWPMFNRDITHESQADPSAGGTLLNISTRGLAGPNVDLIVGAVVKGGGLKPLLIRGVGPTLRIFGVSGPMADPALTLYVTKTAPVAVLHNDNWGDNENSTEIAGAAVETGAFALPVGSKDAAVLTTVGSDLLYTTTIESADGGSGTALAEIYDADPSTTGAKLANLSTRGHVDTGENVLIAGLVIGGSGRLRVLVRAVGPGLVPYGVSGVLAHPSLVVRQIPSQATVGANTGWLSQGLKGDIAVAETQVGAFPLSDSDSALILSLQPGAYTVIVAGADGGTGEALAEAYVLPN